MPDPLRRLPDAELEVMQALWACPPPAERGQIEKKLSRTPPLALTTLLTLLSRLNEKGFLAIEKSGRRNRYIPLISEEEYLAAQSKRFFEKLCRGNISAFANALCGSGISREEIEHLRTLLEKDEL